MPRWEPHSRERLESAALDLYATKGYAATTIGETGVTSRTYFRYFPDKREVLFGSAEGLRDRVTSSLRDAPEGLTSLGAAMHALKCCDDLFRLRDHEDLRRRDVVIDSSEELQEREARKLRSMVAAVASGLEGRGTDDPANARLVADLAIVVFVEASRLWMVDPGAAFASAVDRAAAHVHEVVSTNAVSSAHG